MTSVLARLASCLAAGALALVALPQAAQAQSRIKDIVSIEGVRARLRDLHSTNGTFVAEKPIEEAMRALYAGQNDRFTALVEDWPGDIPRHAVGLAGIGVPD